MLDLTTNELDILADLLDNECDNLIDYREDTDINKRYEDIITILKKIGDEKLIDNPYFKAMRKKQSENKSRFTDIV